MNVRRIVSGLYTFVKGAAYCLYLVAGGFVKGKHRPLLDTILDHFSHKSGTVIPNYLAASADFTEKLEPLRPEAKVPKITVDELIGSKATLTITELSCADGNVSQLELIIIAAIVHKADPARSLEIGTFDGRTTLNIAFNQRQGTEVLTIDLPAEHLEKVAKPLAFHDKKFIEKSSSGSRFVQKESPARIIQLYGDSAAYDFSGYANSVDLMFIDGSHSYEYALSDSYLAQSLLRRGGVIIWHDYDTPHWYGVTRALNELYDKEVAFKNMKHVDGTSLCLLYL